MDGAASVNQGGNRTTAFRNGSRLLPVPCTSPKQRSFGFKPFKQAVFLDRGAGGASLQVSFKNAPVSTSASMFTESIATLKPASEPSVQAIAGAPDVIFDKKKTQFKEGDLPKPDEVLHMERELLSIKSCMPRFVASLGVSYPCVGCEDVFPTLFSLEDHMHRLSYSLVLDCPVCLTKKTFWSKCSMYEHLVTHYSDIATRVQVAEANSVITPLPRSSPVPKQLTCDASFATKSDSDCMRDSPDVTNELKVEDELPKRTKSASLSDSTSSSCPVQSETEPRDKFGTVSETTSDSESVLVTGKVEPIEVSVKEEVLADAQEPHLHCTECSATFDSAEGHRAHFKRSQPAEEPLLCAPCSKLLATPCGLHAHIRVHKLSEPFTCPDCGARMFKKNVFLKHLRLVCLHFSKIGEFLCPTCTESFRLADDQLKHLKQNPHHLRFNGEKSYYKCNGCPKAFKSTVAHSRHKTCPGAGCSVVHMCNNCPQQMVFRSFSELQTHREQAHPQLKWTSERSTVYACYMCAHKTRTLAGFTDHLFKAHQKRLIEFMCNFCGMEAESEQSLERHYSICVVKSSLSAGGSESYEEKTPQLSPSSSVSDLSASQSELRDSDQCFSTPTAALNMTQMFNCHICTAQYNTYSRLRDHVTDMHKGLGMIYECWICHDKGASACFFRQKALDKHMVDAHKLQIQSGSKDSRKEQEVDESRPKRLKLWHEKTYQCCRCDYLTEAAQDFQEHIRDHKKGDDCVQCGECGMCFSVQIALRRHLFAVHKVSDFIKYSRNQYMVQYEKQLNNTEGKCPVCSKALPSDLLLRQHIRTHGMVFINTKRPSTVSAFTD